MTGDPIGEGVAWVRDGGLLAYPTETVWGLGADARSAAALGALSRWKGRDPSAPFAILIADPCGLGSLGFELGEVAQGLIDAFWPGPLTLILPCQGRFAAGISGQRCAVGVRCSSHPLTAAIARRLEGEGVGPMTATSLNRSGAPPARTRQQAREACPSIPGSPHLIEVDGAEAGGDTESTVIDASAAQPRVLRWGALGRSDLAPVVGELEGP
jgi:L-threonylcarbamoyladenylate synthase